MSIIYKKINMDIIMSEHSGSKHVLGCSDCCVYRVCCFKSHLDYDCNNYNYWKLSY